MNVAYVSGPYRAPTIEGIGRNIEAAREVAKALWRQGWAVICPHSNTAFFDGILDPDDPSADAQGFLCGDLALVDRLEPGSDVLVLEGDWPSSRGSVGERSQAINNGIEVFEWPADAETLARLAYRGVPIVIDVPDSPDD